MKIIKIDLDDEIDSRLTEEIEKRIYYVSESIISFEVINDDSKVKEIDIKVEDDCDIGEVKEKLNILLDKDIKLRNVVKERKVFERDFKPEYKENIYEEMLSKGMVFKAGEGQVAFGNLYLNLMDFIDKKITEISIGMLKGKQYKYPTIIPTKVVQKCGYFDSFPHFMMFTTHIDNDMEKYVKFKEMYKSEGKITHEMLNEVCSNVDYCLPPTMCYHMYNQFENKVFKEDESMVITAKGKSFRYESKYENTIERLWDFTIRETALFGSIEFVKSSRQTFMEAMYKVIDDLQLTGCCITASDPFFIDEQVHSKVIFQKLLQAKYELRLNISKDKTISVGSFNFHDNHFSDSFNLKFENGNNIKTGCTGFGLERFAYAFICQHGIDVEKWPKEAAEYIKKIGG